MDRELASRIELLEAAAAKGEKALARQRRLIEELRDDGHRTADAEEALQRYEASHCGLLEKLAGLRIDCTSRPSTIPPAVRTAMRHTIGDVRPAVARGRIVSQAPKLGLDPSRRGA
jgi:hypothetical protein